MCVPPLYCLQAVLKHSGHWLLRIYGTFHLLAVYAALVGGLPGFKHILQPAHQKPLLTAIGLWHPSVAAGMLPLLGLLLVVSCCTCTALLCMYCPAVHVLPCRVLWQSLQLMKGRAQCCSKSAQLPD